MSTRFLIGLASLALFAAAPAVEAFAQDRKSATGNAKQAQGGQSDVDSEHIFGFTEGSDIGDKGDREAEVENFGRFGKRTGFYAATSTQFLYKYSPADHVRIAPFISFASHNISNVPGLDNKAQWLGPN